MKLKFSLMLLTIACSSCSHVQNKVVPEENVANLLATSTLSSTCKGKPILVSGKKVYWSPNDQGDYLEVYPGKYRPVAISACNNGVITVFRIKDKGDQAYFSPNCLHVGYRGLGSDTELAYKLSGQSIVELKPHPHGDGVLAAWEYTSRHTSNTKGYHSPDCRNIGGSGSTTSYPYPFPTP